MIGFAETRVCRHEQVAEHFGEDFAGPCGACDVCVPVDSWCRVDLQPTAAAARGHRRGDRRRGRVADVAAGTTEPRRHAARLVESAAVSASLRRVPDARRRNRRRRSAMGAADRELGRARRGDDSRWLQGPARRPLGRATADPVDRLRRRGRGARHATAQLAPRALAGRCRSRRTWSSTTRRFASSPLSRPQTRDELAGVKGFGPVKLDRYGDDLLAVLSASA